MIYVGTGVSKDKHDCCIVNSDGEILADTFTVANNMDSFDLLFQKFAPSPDCSRPAPCCLYLTLGQVEF